MTAARRPPAPATDTRAPADSTLPADATQRFEPTIEVLGEDALLLRFGNTIDPGTNARVHALARRIGARRPAWLLDIVPAYASLAVFVGVALTDASDPLQAARQWLQAELRHAPPMAETGRLLEIPVHYGGVDGPDLEALAAHAGLSPDEVIARHAGGEYMVAMLGFAPGFPYLLGLDPALAMPRLPTPRREVAAGSVGIAGMQTGVYPRRGPGGWRVIGRTDLSLFDPLRAVPSLLAPGDRVRFVPIVGVT
jgi:KipI family sensor histidine kinase inhibitor